MELAVGSMKKKKMQVFRVVLCLCLHQLTTYVHRHYLLVLAEAASELAYPNKLELYKDLRLSLQDSFDDKGNLIPNTRHFSAAIPALNQAWFLPILATPSFTSPNSPTSESSPGFAFGFFFAPSQYTVTHTIANIYLAVCGGLSRRNSSTGFAHLMGIYDDPQGISFSVPTVRDGYAIPMWYANVPSLTSYKAALVVKEVADKKKNNTITKQLQLEDHDGTVFWKVRNAGLMKIQKTGILVIYDAVDKTKVLWRSPRDTLFRGEKLNVGKMLTSIGSSYSAHMEEGGIVLSLNTLQFMNEQPAPYWAVPLELFDSIDNPLNASKQVFLKSPCASWQWESSNKSLGYQNVSISNQVLPLSSPAYAMLDNSLNFILSSGPCTSSFLSMLSSEYGSNANESGPLSFVKLEVDGWLHSYAVPLQLDNQAAINKDSYVLDVYEAHVSAGDAVQKNILQLSVWEHCASPNYCGPLGVCSRSSPSNPCTCPSDHGTTFQFIDSKNRSGGCSRLNPLPHCNKDEHVNTTDFLQLNYTASIFLFSGWAFNSTPGEVTYCKSLCLANCYCNGFFYNFACFFITDEMSLLNLTDYTWEGLVDIQSSNYVTYLKKQKFNLSSSNPAPRSPSPESFKSITIAIATLLSFATCIGLGVAVYLIRAREAKRRCVRKQAAKEEEELKEVLPLLPSRFSYDELHRATKGFSELLGAGGCGSVYAGTLLDGTKVAVKALELAVKWQSKQFLAEVATIGRTSHHNIVRLVGFCWEVSNRLLVYEYMENGSLDQWLFIKAGGINAPHVGAPLLDWQARYNVVLGMARGLSYLHDDCPQPILHFDIKPQNILLDRAFVAKLADFGMSKLMQRDISEVVTGVRGTPGYIAPEWVSHGTVSKKSDVYSMGVVMLEIVGGRKNVDLDLLNHRACLKHDSTSGQIEEEWHFVSWAARKCEQGVATDVVDRRLQCAYNEEEAQRLIYIAFWCIQEDAGMRPYVPTVVKWVEGSCAVPKPPFASAAHYCSRSNKPISSQRLSLTDSSSSTPLPPLT